MTRRECTRNPLRSLRTITRKHEVFELFLPVVARLAMSVKEMRYIILNKIIGAVGHAFKSILNGTITDDLPK